MKHFTIKPRHLVSVALLSFLALPACGSGGDSDGSGGDGGDSGDTGGSNSGTGGAGTGGGATTGGAPGTGGGVASVCDGNVSAPVAAQVSDLESGTATGWDVYVSTPDDAGTTTPADLEEIPPEIVGDVEGDGNDTTKAAHYAGEGWYSYGAGINFNLEGCKDLSAYTGVRFLAKGSTTPGADQDKPPTLTPNALNFRVITAGAHGQIIQDGVNVGGDCVVSSNKCFLPPQKDIILTEEWQEFEIDFADLTVPAGANPGSALNETKSNAMLLGWHTSNGDFDFWLDEVEFY